MTAKMPDCEWRKSSYSGGNGGNCVEVGVAGSVIGLRDSKDPDGGVLVVSERAWNGFVSALRNGRYQRRFC